MSCAHWTAWTAEGNSNQEAVAGGFDDMTLVGSDGVLDDLVMQGQQA